MNDHSNRDKLLGLAHAYVDAHEQEFDSKDPGLFWGDALCDVLGGAEYLVFGRATTDTGEVITVLPVFGEPVYPQQFTPEQIGTVVAAYSEIQDAAPTSPDGLDTSTEDWILSFAVRAGAAHLDAGNPPALAEALYATAFWLMNTVGGLLDLTGIARPRPSGPTLGDAGGSADEADADPVV